VVTQDEAVPCFYVAFSAPSSHNEDMTDIAVIVVNWNACEDLRRCLKSLWTETNPSPSWEVWVVDNASTDGSAAMVQQEFPQARLIVNANNRGFSQANNQAIAISESRFVFLLNSDAQVHPGALAALTAFADMHPQAGIIGPKVLNPDGSLQFSCRRFPSLSAGLFRNTLLGRLFPGNRFARNYLMGDVSHTDARPVDWVSGCAMLIRRDLIAEIGALDERFFMYCEDVDICWRCQQAGKEVWYAPEAVVSHAIGASSDKNAEPMIVEFHRSWYEFDRKRHPGFHPLRRLLVGGGLGLRAAIRVANRRRALRRLRNRRPAPSLVETRPQS
jgi:GT2 family glycosyltransferase